MRPVAFILAVATTALLSLMSASAQVTWQTRMIQTQISGATGLPELVVHKGTKPSLPIGTNGSRFELWGWQLNGSTIMEENLLATTEVGTYKPQAIIIIATLDPYTGFLRSRVDQPFTVTYKISGLKPSGPGNPISSQKVRVEHYADLYVAGCYDGTQVASRTLVRSFEITTNGDTPFTFPVTNITATDLAKRAGRERFIVYGLADGTTSERIIAQANLEIYPLPEGNLANLDPLKIYRSLPPFTATVLRSYPLSSTWVELYQGNYSATKRGTTLGTTRETPSLLYPEPAALLTFDTFPIALQPTVNGSVTFVVRTSSPYPGESIQDGGMILSYATIQMKTNLTLNTMLTTVE